MANDRVLVVENDGSVRTTLRQYLESTGCEVVEAATCGHAHQLWRESHPDIVILDDSLPDGNALECLKELRKIDSSIPFVILAARASLEQATEALKAGADHVLAKPVELAALGLVTQRILESQRNHRRHTAETAREGRNAADPFVGTSPAIRRLAEMATQVAANDGPVLIQGEVGTGKELLAHWIHKNGRRSSQPFMKLNRGGFQRDLLEAEVFGHQGGAFAGVSQSSRGLLELAHRGTVLLDEIRDFEWQLQPKLLKFLDNGQFTRVGDVVDRRVDVRLISATRHNLQALVRQGQFRDDLYSRVSACTLIMPAVRERVEDVPNIVNYLLTKLTHDIGSGPRELNAEAMRAMQQYPWPGNIRELHNVLERAVLLSSNRVLTERDLHLEPRRDAVLVANTSDKTLDQVERQYIQAILNQEGGRVEVAAKKLGIPRSSLYYKLKQYGLRRTGTTVSQHT